MRLARGQQYGFRLVANPVHTVTDAVGKKKRLAHVSARYQLGWLADRADSMGVRFPIDMHQNSDDFSPGEPPSIADCVRLSSRETLKFKRREHQVTLTRVQFDGVLEITDVAQLRSALTNGIGRGKAYGCGLLTLAPLTSIRN